MIKCILTVGIPGSGKSTWAKAEVAKDPLNWCRINNDDIRSMFNGSVYTPDYENLVTSTREFLIREAFKNNKNVIIDNLNLNKRHWETTCKIAKSMNKDIQVYEKLFYIDLEEAIIRDSKREGKAKVGESVIKDWWKKSGGKQLKFHNPKVEIITRANNGSIANTIHQIIFNPKLANAIIVDLDGTLALLNGRNPYDAANCENDLPNIPVIETVKLYHKAGYKIIFCSGRQDKYETATRNFIDVYCENVEYELFMRRTDDYRKDSIIKEEIYNAHIKDKYNVFLILDDRTQVCELWRNKLGLTCFQVNWGDF